MKRRLALALILLGADIANAAAQAYPTKVVKIVVPSTAGSPTDAAARVLAQQLQSRLGQSVIVENRPGAGQTTGTKSVATAAPDGYTLLFAGDALGYFPVTYPNFNFDPLKSLTPVATAVTWSHVMVVASDIPAKTIAELVAYAKANPGRLIFGLRFGTVPHILAEAFRQATGTDITFVPYTGGEQARADLLGGRVHLNFAPVANLISLIEDGRVRPLAFTGSARAAMLPDVPTMIESGLPQVGFNPDVWLGILGPAGMPAAVVDRLNSDVSASLQSAEMKAVLARLGFEPKAMTPREFEDFLAAEIRKWPPLLRAAGLKPE
jgi:tripartite-type tricarboxylate transporter receptor subunit TctC